MGGLHGQIPAQLDWMKSTSAGREWLKALPRVVDECAEHWGLRLGEPFPYAYTSLAIPARWEDGAEVVLKVRFLDRETEHEALALRHWSGNGVVRLLDEHRNAMLLERCIPGTSLSDAGRRWLLTCWPGSCCGSGNRPRRPRFGL